MKVDLGFGREMVTVEIPEQQLIHAHRSSAAPPVADVAEATAKALEEPFEFPSLRRALTPDDHLAVAFDETLPVLPPLLAALFQHLARAAASPSATTLLFPTEVCRQQWLDVLPAECRGAASVVHEPEDPRTLSYLATTSGGRRIYLSRALVEADQVVALGRRGYDPLLGYAGAESVIYPALSDAGTRRELAGNLSMGGPDDGDWPVQEEAAEVAWLLGAPFFLQVIEGANDSITHVVGGLSESSDQVQALLDARWRTTVPRLADVVIAGIGGNPSRHSFRDLARALACAVRVVRANGRVILLSGAGGELGPGAAILRGTDDPREALRLLQKEDPPDRAAAFQWANGVQQASVYLLSALSDETTEELFATPLQNARQAPRLLDGAGSCLILPDAHKTLAVLEE